MAVEAAPCRRSWSRIGRRPVAFTCASNTALMVRGNADPPRSCRGRSTTYVPGRVTTIPCMGDRLSRDRLADRSGVDPEYLDRLVSLGILTAAVDGTFAGSARQVVRL